MRNDQVDWDRFDPERYRVANYQIERDDDRWIVQHIRDFFASSLPVDAKCDAVDIGTGSNLYPALAMLPFSDRITLYERSHTSVQWLCRQQAAGYDPDWDPFWDTLAASPTYRQFGHREGDLRAAFRRVVRIVSGNVFDLGHRQWDLGTMFFVACSISTEKREFRSAVESFVGSLVAGAPFAASFMTNSDGYRVGPNWFPAVPVDRAILNAVLGPVTRDLDLREVPSDMPLRPGVGMILATGFAG